MFLETQSWELKPLKAHHSPSLLPKVCLPSVCPFWRKRSHKEVGASLLGWPYSIREGDSLPHLRKHKSCVQDHPLLALQFCTYGKLSGNSTNSLALRGRPGWGCGASREEGLPLWALSVEPEPRITVHWERQSSGGPDLPKGGGGAWECVPTSFWGL